MLHFILEAEIKEARAQIKRTKNDGEMKRRYPVLAGTTRQSERKRREMKVVRCVTTFSRLHSSDLSDLLPWKQLRRRVCVRACKNTFHTVIIASI